MIMWTIIRAGGIAAYVTLFASVAWGTVATTSVFGKKVAKASSISVHQYLSTASLVFVAVHVVTLIVDTFMRFTVWDALVPMASSYRPGGVAFGIFATYAMVIVMVSSWIKKRIPNNLWRTLHLLAIPALAMSIAHGLAAGSDTGRAWMWWMYVVTGTIVVFLTILRGLTHGLRPQRAARPDHAPAPRPRAMPEPAEESESAA
jgi:sulfoxide reductase heme-binding subunit YedZ